jgi:hypothetical protein
MLEEALMPQAVDCTTMVMPCTRVHILHGGRADPFGVRAVVTHLQQTWCAALVVCDTPSHLKEIAGTLSQTSSATRPLRSLQRLIVCVASSVVAQAPTAYDVLTAQDGVTCAITVPVSTLCGAPYSRRCGITAILLPSTRLDMDNIRTVEVVYRFPNVSHAELHPGDGVDAETSKYGTNNGDGDGDGDGDGGTAVNHTRKDSTSLSVRSRMEGTSSTALRHVKGTTSRPASRKDGTSSDTLDGMDAMLWVLPHDFAIAWLVGRSSRASVIDVTNAVAANRRQLQDVQTAADRAWWWSRGAGVAPAPLSLPAVVAGLAAVRGAPFAPAHDPCFRRHSDNTLAFVTSQTHEQLYLARSNAVVAKRSYDAHVVNAEDDVVPIRLCLNETVDAVAAGTTYAITMTCKCTFPSPSATPSPDAKRTWKTYAGVL